MVEISGMQHISSVVNKANTELLAYKTGSKRALLTFSNKLNSKIEGIYPSDQIVIAARTGVGKSAFVNILMKSLIDLNPKEKILILYWSFEMPNYQQIFRLYSSFKAIPVKKITSGIDPIDDNTYKSILDYGEHLKHKYNIYFRDIPVNAEQWMKMVTNAQNTFPEYRIVNIIDHTRLIRKNSDGSEERKITDLMERGVEIKNYTGCINIFLSQLNRNIESGDSRRDMGSSVPVLTDIFGADSVAQFATLIMILHRPELYGKREYTVGNVVFNTQNLLACHVLKQRDGWTGMISMKHDLAINKIEDWNVTQK